ncbi:Cytochrome P450 704C1 [Spatholobus suberectus]|nr:Cytochrome P450 704C1 [Spatholobus suberectus]
MRFVHFHYDPMFAIATFAAIASILFIFRAHFRRFICKKGRHHVVAGTVLDQLFNFHRLYDYMTDLARKHKTYQLLNFYRSEVYTADPVNVEYILKTNFASYGKELFMKSTLDSVLKIVLGVDLDTICGTYEEGTEFSNAFDEASAITLYQYVDVFWKIKRFLNIGSEAVLRNRIKVVDEFVYKLIRIKTASAKERKANMVSSFLALKETDAKYLRDIILNFMIAGRDTTAATLSWFLYILCKHPHVQEKIVHEVAEAAKLKNTYNIDELADSLTEENPEKMHYLHAALSETLRLYPAVSVDGKLCLSDETLPDGFSIRKSGTISYQPYAMGRMKFIWGDDAEEFRLERWLDESGTFQQKSSFKFTAFQARSRICLGKDFAYRQMKIFAAALCHTYKFKLAIQNESVNYRTMLTLHIDGGLHLHASQRFEPMC